MKKGHLRWLILFELRSYTRECERRYEMESLTFALIFPFHINSVDALYSFLIIMHLKTNIYFTFHFIFNLQYFQIMINYLCLIAYTHTLLTLYINKNKYTHTHTCQATDDIDFGSLHVVLMPQLTLRISACIFGGSSLLLEHKFNVSLRERYSRAHWKNSNSGIEAH